MLTRTHAKSALLAATFLGMLPVSTTAWAQGADDEESAADIIVTARRVEERLQDVPISITVLNQEALSNNNLTQMKDLAALTPGLQINARYGADASNFSIRGFTQEQRTFATVGTYFGDVVAPRGSGASTGGDGAGPGALFDLQNVQVLKGPQGTLQGRNATGGAVMLVPRKPSDKLEGYVEASLGDYDLQRVQGVINIPFSDTFRVRAGLDRMTRDGYLKNYGALGDGAHGDKGMGNIDYWAARLSIVADLTPELENYLIATWSNSKSNGVIPHTFRCTTGQAFSAGCAAQLIRLDGKGAWAVENRLPDSRSDQQMWQIQDTLTWKASDSLTVKNIISYGEFRSQLNLDLYGNYFPVSFPVTSGNQVAGFAFTHANPFTKNTNAQSSFVEELRFELNPADSGFTYQGGLYAELNDPLGVSGVQTSTFGRCADIDTLDCAAGSPNMQLSSTKFRNYAIYSQAGYNILENLKLTLGARYTWDEQKSVIQMEQLNIGTGLYTCQNISYFGGTVTGPLAERFGACKQNISNKSKAPTWLIGLDFKPIEDVLLYAKYARGYRQGGVSLFSPDTSQLFKKETVDSYEIGAKTSWRGAMPGTFNVSAYHNDFKNQQLLLGVLDLVANPVGVLPGAPSASIVNAGNSWMKGFEADLTIKPFRGLSLSAGYAYLKTKIVAVFAPTFPATSPYDTVLLPIKGDPVPNSIPHRVNLTGSYTLPLPESIGKVSLGGTFVYTSAYQGVVNSDRTGANVYKDGHIMSSKVLNLNLNWENVAEMPVDLGLFVTNVTNEVVQLTANANGTRGFVSGIVGEPRMFGARVKVKFGE